MASASSALSQSGKAQPDASDISGNIARDAEAHGYTLDRAQRKTLRHFQQLADELAESPAGLFRLFSRKRALAGIYLWGGVGRGKSFLMDGFYANVALVEKRRVHFHRFMQEIHRSLRELQGRSDPMVEVARRIAGETRLLCLDEFHVTDIGDAMLMRGLLEGLFEQNVAIVTTSNRHPDALYQDGLQRAEFLPSIALIKDNLKVIAVDGGIDYRLRALEKVEIYHVPADTEAERNLEAAFTAIAGHAGDSDYEMEIEARALRARRHADGVVWFDFSELCDGPRAQADYIELARNYHTVLLSGIPKFAGADADRMRRFTWLVDEFYDRRVKLIASAAGSPEKLCAGGKSTNEIERAVSRLIEMQTRGYLSEEHKG